MKLTSRLSRRVSSIYSDMPGFAGPEFRIGRFDLYRECSRGAAMTQANTLMLRSSIRPDRPVPSSLALLIEVPEVKVGRGRRLHLNLDWHREGRRPSTGRRKRRLRREVRIAGCILLVLAPLVSACTVGWSSGPVRVLACSITDSNAANGNLADRPGALDLVERSDSGPSGLPGVVVLSIEPTTLTPGTDNEVPVIFPGYVLPDDSLGDSTHEGS
jgi:hypothetical protein